MIDPIDFILHFDLVLGQILAQFGIITYFLLFLIIFCETGLVFLPFLPGDSLLFVAGTFAAKGDLNIWILFFSLSAAAIIGDSVNYFLGKKFGKKVFIEKKLLDEEYFEKARQFFEKHGGKTIILARFMPIIRTFAPFVAGIGKMDYFQFLQYNALGGIVWVALFLFSGYFFGSVPIVKENLSVIIIAIIVISLIPAIAEFVKHQLKKKKK